MYENILSDFRYVYNDNLQLHNVIYRKILQDKKRKTNPTVEKIMDICNVLQITPEQLLTGKGIEDEEEIAASSPESKFTPGDV